MTIPLAIWGTAPESDAHTPIDVAQLLDRRHAVVNLGDEPLPLVMSDDDGKSCGSAIYPRVSTAAQAAHNLRSAVAVSLVIQDRDAAELEPETDPREAALVDYLRRRYSRDIIPAVTTERYTQMLTDEARGILFVLAAADAATS